jgi:hypothetical protein
LAMKYAFRAKIYKVGINPCVEVPLKITSQMVPAKGYIPIKGMIMKHPFEQTLVPVKKGRYRLYVNGLMLRGSGTKVGDIAKFSIEQTFSRRRDVAMLTALKKKLIGANLFSAFKKLTPSRQKEILRYLNYLKTEEAKSRNIEKVLELLRER